MATSTTSPRTPGLAHAMRARMKHARASDTLAVFTAATTAEGYVELDRDGAAAALRCGAGGAGGGGGDTDSDAVTHRLLLFGVHSVRARLQRVALEDSSVQVSNVDMLLYGNAATRKRHLTQAHDAYCERSILSTAPVTLGAWSSTAHSGRAVVQAEFCVDIPASAMPSLYTCTAARSRGWSGVRDFELRTDYRLILAPAAVFERITATTDTAHIERILADHARECASAHIVLQATHAPMPLSLNGARSVFRRNAQSVLAVAFEQVGQYKPSSVELLPECAQCHAGWRTGMFRHRRCTRKLTPAVPELRSIATKGDSRRADVVAAHAFVRRVNHVVFNPDPAGDPYSVFALPSAVASRARTQAGLLSTGDTEDTFFVDQINRFKQGRSRPLCSVFLENSFVTISVALLRSADASSKPALLDNPEEFVLAMRPRTPIGFALTFEYNNDKARKAGIDIKITPHIVIEQRVFLPDPRPPRARAADAPENPHLPRNTAGEPLAVPFIHCSYHSTLLALRGTAAQAHTLTPKRSKFSGRLVVAVDGEQAPLLGNAVGTDAERREQARRDRWFAEHRDGSGGDGSSNDDANNGNADGGASPVLGLGRQDKAKKSKKEKKEKEKDKDKDKGGLAAGSSKELGGVKKVKKDKKKGDGDAEPFGGDAEAQQLAPLLVNSPFVRVEHRLLLQFKLSAGVSEERPSLSLPLLLLPDAYVVDEFAAQMVSAKQREEYLAALAAREAKAAAAKQSERQTPLYDDDTIDGLDSKADAPRASAGLNETDRC